MPKTGGATPLLAVPRVVVDTETTGLDTATARIVQIGAVREDPATAEHKTYETLVSPGIPIPLSSTEIHNISDSDVDGAPDFASAFPDFSAFLEGAVVVGHSVGFDLAILERECGRANLDWPKQRFLDTRLLAEIAQPNLPDFALETVAAWLEIEIEGRHSALGDAVATARVFDLLVPHLRARGIRTLAEAEAASARITEATMNHARAGWVDPSDHRPPASERPLSKIDSYPYRHRVVDVMTKSPRFIARDAALSSVIDTLISERISSLFVDMGDGETGIITERDALRALAEGGAAALDAPPAAHISAPLETVPSEAFIYRAIGRMSRLKVRHLGVRDAEGTVVGALSARDLLRLRASEAISLGDEIDTARDVPALAAAWGKVPAVVGALIEEGVDARTAAAVVSREMGAITRRCTQLAEKRIEADGLGAAPVPYTILMLGSGGRGESMLATDQDNALIYEGDEDNPEHDAWFEQLGSHLADNLDAVGIRYCHGGVMAKNATWRHSLGGWKRQVDDWIRRSRPQDLLNVDIFYDFRPVCGEDTLASELWAYSYEHGSKSPDFAKLLGETVDEGATPFTMFGGLKLEDGRIDAKKFGLFPIVTIARVLGVRHDLRKRATPKRLQAIIELDIGGARDLQALVEAHQLLMRLILNQQLDDIHAGRGAGNRIAVGALSKADQNALKEALHALSGLDHLIRDLMFANA